MSSIPKIRIGTRGSKLALWQANHVRDMIIVASPATHVELVSITTSGDRIKGSLAKVGGKGLYVKEIEDALLARHVDIAVHSMKDLPCDLPAGLVVIAVSEREDTRDALLMKSAGGADSLPRGARVGTTSLRRQHQFRTIRPDCEFVTVRGNVDTRVRKLAAGEYDALIVAMAGLKRLGIGDAEIKIVPLSTDQMIPAIGQGVLAIEARAEDTEMSVFIRGACNDDTAEIAMAAERAVMKAVGGDCFTPLAAHAEISDDTLRLSGWLATTDGARAVKGERNISSCVNVDKATVVGMALGEELKKKL